MCAHIKNSPLTTLMSEQASDLHMYDRTSTGAGSLSYTNTYDIFLECQGSTCLIIASIFVIVGRWGWNFYMQD